MKQMNKFVGILFILVIASMAGAALLQIFVPSFLGSSTEYGMNPGWQREIGIWNLGMITILLFTLIKGSSNTVKIVISGAIVLGIGFGTNHLFGFVQNPNMYMNFVGAIENYLFVALLIFGIAIKPAKHPRSN